MTRFPEQKTDTTATTVVDAMVLDLIEQAKRCAADRVFDTLHPNTESQRRWPDCEQLLDGLAARITSRLSAPTLAQIEAAAIQGANSYLELVCEEGSITGNFYDDLDQMKDAILESIAALYPTQSKEAPE